MKTSAEQQEIVGVLPDNECVFQYHAHISYRCCTETLE